MEKAPDAFRTISEVAEDLDIPAHVLRFWETRFVQIKPMKRSGGRRYYRPDDVELLRGIRRLLYGEGYTIRGVQRILREHGVKAVQNLDEATLAPASLSGPAFEALPQRAAHEFSSDDEEETAELDEEEVEDADDVEEADEDEELELETDSPPLRPSMDFVPSMSERIGPLPPAAAKRAPDVPVATVTKPATLRASMSHNGADAYAPPEVRHGLHQSGHQQARVQQTRIRGDGQAKLRSVLDDLLSARALLDRAMGG
ncbi:MAG: MerR family transcriptional regulator [Afipia felis]|nr:MerR family transcriptional regulator [Afipia felis]